MYDVIIIGAGVTGASVARELSRFHVKACVLEKEEDVCCGTSKANSAIVHAGYDAKEGTLMAKLNVQGNKMMPALSKELDIPFLQNGSFVICHNEEDFPSLQALFDRGVANGVEGMSILYGEDIQKMEPSITEGVYAALYAPTAGIVCPFELNIAMAENANTNGVEFKFNTQVEGFEKIQDGWKVKTNKGEFETKYIVNAAGVYADKFHNMVSADKIHITARRGSYFLLDKQSGKHVATTVFTLPTQYGKGIVVAPTVHGNLLLGPTAVDIDDKEETSTSQTELDAIRTEAGKSVAGLNLRTMITSFAGLRAHEDGREFIIGEVNGAEGFIDCAGIESPGLTSAPAIGEMVANILQEKMQLEKNPEFNGSRKGIFHPDTMSIEERNVLIKEKPEYGRIVCRCEMITEGEIIDALTRPLPAKSLDGVKRRTRAGMGRCQAGFCSPRTMEIIANTLGIPLDDVTKSGGNSKIIMGINKDLI